jgi:hypothetical protein
MRICLCLVILFTSLMTNGQNQSQRSLDSLAVEVSTVLLSRDKNELEQMRQLTLNFERKDAGTRKNEVLTVMQREISQMKNKIQSARQEIGQNRAVIVQDLELNKGRRDNLRTYYMRQRVKQIKDDQRDVKKLERYLEDARKLMTKFERTEIKASNLERVIDLLREFEKVMENDIMWTQRELNEDKRELRH